MYINKIDDLIDKVIDDFYAYLITNDKGLQKIFQEVNFIKFQKEINLLMIAYTNTINLTEVRELVKSSDAVNSIAETLKRYVAFYMFLLIGFHYTSKDDTYINNVVEFSKNQSEYGYKINNFFNSESNALIIKYNMMIKNILILLEADQSKIDILKTKPDFREAILFLNQVDYEFIEKNFRLDGAKDKNVQAHNIIKTLIILLLYKTTEKKEFFRFLEMTENLDGEYMFIDIVVPKQKYIDFNSVEKLLGSSKTIKNLSYYFWQFLTEHEEEIQKPPTSIEEKIIALIQSGILYPICDDFLLYHKDSERYDRTVDPAKIKKKEDTKIRYVINKIETTSEYYSDQIRKDEKIRANIKKNFYVPLLNRKAILVNNNEDIHIINKFLNQGKRSVENNEYFNDLVNYKMYPYINFKEFDNFGFSITLPKTIDVVRCISLSREGEFRVNSRDKLQTRTGTRDVTINVVGFLIPTTKKPIQCVTSGEMIDIRSISKTNKNGFQLMMKYLKESNFGLKEHSSSIFWLFDLEKDIVPTSLDYEQSTKHSVSEQVKQIAGTLYDSIIGELYYHVIDRLEKTKELNLQTAYKILKKFQKSIITVPNGPTAEQLEEKIYSLIVKVIPEYDKTEDIIFGISDDSIKLPELEPEENLSAQNVTINLSKENEKIEGSDEYDIVDGICQHNISWDRLSTLQKTNPKIYVDMLYAFIQQYVIENVDQEFVCKSCGHQLNIKKYIVDGVFDDDTQRFVSYGTVMDIPLEEIPEYEKYKITIRNIDKLIEKIAIVSVIPHLMKSSSNIKWRRKAIIKDLIDLLMMNNKKLSVNKKERNEMASKTYGINRELSDLFVFDLDNTVFVFSSKDKDQYKAIKQNNIVAYLIFLVILEINDAHVLSLGNDRKGLCNFMVFDKVFYQLFDGLKIRINNKGDLAPLTNYKILCYIIYIVGCSVIKYNMWAYDYPDPTKKKTYIAIIQKIFVHTLIDVINSVLEVASSPDVHYLYDIVSIKLYKKFTTTFVNEELYTRLRNEYKTSAIGEKKNFILTKRKLTDLDGKYIPMKFDSPYRVICRPPKLIIKSKATEHLKFYEINNITSCATGDFHDWGQKSGKIVCKSCNIEASNAIFNDSETKKIISNFKFVRLQNLATKYCLVDGSIHYFTAGENNLNICIKCNNDEKHLYKNEELLKLEKLLEDVKHSQEGSLAHKSGDIQKIINREDDYIKKTIDGLRKEYQLNSKDKQFKFIDGLIDELQTIMGNDMGSNVYLRENAYIINHDHLGYPMDKHVTMTDADNKIFYKQNHSFYKTDVIYYTSHKNGKMEIFYDAMTKILLGYKEESKNFVYDKKQDRRLIVNYSVLNKIKMLGYPSQFIDIESTYNKLVEDSSDVKINKEAIYKVIICGIIRQRIVNLKKVIYEFQRVLFRILNNFNAPIIEDDTEYFSNKIGIIVEKYRKKINDIQITDSSGKNNIFQSWKSIISGIYTGDITDIRGDMEENKTINLDDINKIDHGGNIILYFITDELTKLLKYNPNKFIKINVAQFVVEFIEIVFELFNMEKLSNNVDIKRFEYILESATYIQEISDKVTGLKEIEGMYDEYKESEQEITPEDKEQQTDILEEQDAIDVEEVNDEEYERGIDD